jgi:hypothetical protein
MGCAGAGGSSDPGDTDELTWFSTCGDPVCAGYTGPYDGIDACDGETEGAACGEAGAQCDFESACNATLICAAEDPKDQVGGCPVSRKRHKTDIDYVSAEDLDTLREQALALRLARWRYRTSPEGSTPRLGFLIDDHPDGPAVTYDGEKVDVYGLTSLALAAVQSQEAQIRRLEQANAALEARLSQLEARSATPSVGQTDE